MITVKINEESLRAMIMETVKDVLETVPQPQLNDIDEKFMNADQACIFLGMAKATLYNNVSKGIIPHFKKSKFLYFSKTELIEYLKQGKRKTFYELSNELSKR